MRAIRIGHLARETGIATKTLRYYETMGLVSPVARTPAGYRLFDDSALERLAFVRRAKALGLTLTDIRRILEAREGAEQPCAHILDLLRARLAEVDGRLQAVSQLRSELSTLLDHLEERVKSDGLAPEGVCTCVQEITRWGDHREEEGETGHAQRPL